MSASISPFHIGARKLGPGHPTYIVAELSANHNGQLERALESIRRVAETGADAVKLQTYRPNTITIDAPGADFRIEGGPWNGRTLFDLYDEAHTPWEWHEALFAEARHCGLDVFSSPFDSTAVDLLESLGAPAYKIASFEVVDDGLLRRVARTGKPVIVSTGMANLEEIVHAVRVLKAHGTSDILLLRCTSSYPAPDDQMHLATIPVLRDSLGCHVGLSDHSLGTVAPVVAVTLGACFIEKHFTLDRGAGGPDSHFSLEIPEFRALVADVRRAEAMRGVPTFGPGTAEEGSVQFRRSLYVVADVRAGEQLTADNVRSIRPGFGLSPQFLDVVLNRRVSRDVPRGTALSWDHLLGNGDR